MISFREYIKLCENNTEDAVKSINAGGIDEAGLREWKKFLINLYMFFKMIGPNRLEKLLRTLETNPNANFNTILKEVDPTGRSGNSAPEIKIKNGSFWIDDTVHKDTINEGAFGDIAIGIIASLFKSVFSSIKGILAPELNKFFEKIKINTNPKTDKDYKENKSAIEENRKIDVTKFNELKWAIYGKSTIIALQEKSKLSETQISWLKTMPNLDQFYKAVTPISNKWLFATVKGKAQNENDKPYFDIAVKNFCKNYGTNTLVRMMQTFLSK